MIKSNYYALSIWIMFVLQPCYVEASNMFLIIENFSNNFNVMVMTVYVILFLCGNSTELFNSHISFIYFSLVIMLRLFSFSIQVLDVVDFVATQKEIFWSTSWRVFFSLLYFNHEYDLFTLIIFVVLTFGKKNYCLSF